MQIVVLLFGDIRECGCLWFFVVFVEVIFVCCCVCWYDLRKNAFVCVFLCMKYVDEKGLHGLKSCDFGMNPYFVVFV